MRVVACVFGAGAALVRSCGARSAGITAGFARVACRPVPVVGLPRTVRGGPGAAGYSYRDQIVRRVIEQYLTGARHVIEQYLTGARRADGTPNRITVVEVHRLFPYVVQEGTASNGERHADSQRSHRASIDVTEQ